MFRLTGGHLENTWETPWREHTHHDVDHHASLGATMSAFYVNYTVVCLEPLQW